MKRGVLPAVAFLFAAGCAGAPVHDEAAGVAPGETVIELRARSYSFTPADLTVPAGKPFAIRVSNEATVVPHSFVLSGADGAIVVRKDLVKGGETILRVPPLLPGTYTFYCDVSMLGMSHRGKGMEGRITAAPGQ